MYIIEPADRMEIRSPEIVLYYAYIIFSVYVKYLFLNDFLGGPIVCTGGRVV